MNGVNIISFTSGQAASGSYVTETELALLLAYKQDVLTFDSTPIENSENPVTSGGLYDAIKTAGSQQVVVVGALPTASADTVSKIYYVGPDTDDGYEKYITSYDGSAYTWVHIGSTGDLTSKQDVDSDAVSGNIAIFNASGSTVDSGYYISTATTTEITNLFA